MVSLVCKLVYATTFSWMQLAIFELAVMGNLHPLGWGRYPFTKRLARQ